MASSVSPGPSMKNNSPDTAQESEGSKQERATAANFFGEDDESEKEKANTTAASTHDTVVDLLNEAAVLPKAADKISNLRKVQELIVHNSPDLLDNFLDEMLAYQSDSSKDVKKFTIGFMEEACKKDPECLPKVLPSMTFLLSDEDVNVQKKIILTMSSMFKLTLGWIGKAKKPKTEMSDVWKYLKELKTQLYDMLESMNDGIRTHVVKFLEGFTLALSRKTPESDIPKRQENELTLDQVPETNGIVDVSSLEEDGVKAFSSLLQFQASPHISSINLMTVMNALSNIAKQRPQFFDQIVQSYEALHVNLPPTLAKSQVSSVRKNLKNQLLSLLKHPSSFDFMTQVTTLLTDLGASQSEISKNTPKDVDVRKRKATQEASSSVNYAAKKIRVEVDDDDEIVTPWVNRASKKAKPEPAQKHTAIDVTAEDILPRLTSQNVADLVLLSMVMLPESMPAQFQSTYTPIAAAGTESQIGHIARLMATQLTMAGMGKGLGELQMQAMKESSSSEVLEADEQPSSPKQIIQTVVGLKTDEGEEDPIAKKLKLAQHLPQHPGARKIKQFQLSTVTKPLKTTELVAMSEHSLRRILEAEKGAADGHVTHQRMKMLVTLSTLFGNNFKTILEEFIFNDIRNRHDLAFAWLYQEYAVCQGYSANLVANQRPGLGSYDACLKRLLNGLRNFEDHHADNLFHKLIQEAPYVTDSALAIVRQYCIVPEHTESGMALLTQMIKNRPVHRLNFLDLMLQFTSYENSQVREVSIKAAHALHSSGMLQSAIEKYAAAQLKILLQPKPTPKPKPKVEAEASSIAETWTEETIKCHLYLHLALLPSNHKLIHELASIYTAVGADIKRTILRVLELPVRGMGMDSPELLTLVENCPKGSETLVMRVLHILTDKAVPSPELVERIRDLYHKRVPDVRFLIPVLNGLSKSEVMEALPQLIKLNPLVVKEVFNRLMGSHVSSDSLCHSPLTPVELLVALHNIDPAKCDMKTIIKAANLCFSERNIYTQEIVATVMQKLMELEPLPTLLMRTVIQSFTMYPKLMSLVLNILQRLITKKVWKKKKVWEGFIRCCQKAKPQSFQVLLQLPAAQLKDVFDLCPDLRRSLIEHVEGLTDNQRAYISSSIMAVLQETDELETPTESSADIVEMNPPDENKKAESDEQSIGTIQKIGSIAEPSVQRISTVASGKTMSSSPSRLETNGEKKSDVKTTTTQPKDKEVDKPSKETKEDRKSPVEKENEAEKNTKESKGGQDKVESSKKASSKNSSTKEKDSSDSDVSKSSSRSSKSSLTSTRRNSSRKK